MVSSNKFRVAWNKLYNVFHHEEEEVIGKRASSITSENLNQSSSVDSSSDSSLSSNQSRRRNYRHKKRLIQTSLDDTHNMKIPPFSPTYCKANEFPYSNFYIKLPDGRWMIKYRSGNRDALGTDTVEGYMI